MPDLLIELFSEEIPARMQARASADLKKLVTDGLVEAGLTYAHAGAFATPRRLTLTVEGLLARSPDTREERKGPKVGAPDKAIEGFVRGAGVSREALEVRADKKGEVYFAVIERPGRPAAEIVAEVLEATVRGFPWPKSMRWGSGSLTWVRPLHSILCLLHDEAGAEIVPLEIDGIRAGNSTRGHRFMAPDAFTVTSFEDYAAKLRRAKVMLDPQERADAIANEMGNLAFAGGLEPVADPALLSEVAGLVEWPVPLMGRIDEAFLDLPPEVLQTSMREHQKFFSLRAKSGQITGFVTVANRETADDGATILAGNLKVLAARLSDAKFFWQNDLRVARDEKMAPWRAALERVTFHARLGTQAERIARITALAREIAPRIGADAARAEEAAGLAKLDLASEMVYEFPELQGLMGRYYAEAAGHPAEVAAAAQEHYQPLGPSDDVPSAPLSVAVALADKIDTLTGFWAIDEKPTGSKDPYALRRAALGVIRLVLENDLRLPLRNVADSHGPRVEADMQASVQDHGIEIDSGSYKVIKAKFDELVSRDGEGRRNLSFHSDRLSDAQLDDLLSFFHDRLKVYLREQGVRHDVIDACLAMPDTDDLAQLVRRARALSDFLASEDGGNLLQGFKRAANILGQAEEKDGVEYSFGADRKFAEVPEETALFDALDAAEPGIADAMASEDFAAAMARLAALRGPIDAFFEAVQINAESQILRRNRLNLLSRIRSLCLSVADLTRIEG